MYDYGRHDIKKVKEHADIGLLNTTTTTAINKYVVEIEWGIFWQKEHSRCVVKTLSVAGIFNLPKQIVICIVYYVTAFMNTVPTTLGVSALYSPQKIVTQHKLDIARDC